MPQTGPRTKARNGTLAPDDHDAFPPARQSVDCKVAEAGRLGSLTQQRRDASATVANRVIGKDDLKPGVEELNEGVVG